MTRLPLSNPQSSPNPNLRLTTEWPDEIVVIQEWINGDESRCRLCPECHAVSLLGRAVCVLRLAKPTPCDPRPSLKIADVADHGSLSVGFPFTNGVRLDR